MGNFEEVARGGHLLVAIARGAVERWPGLLRPALERLADRQLWGFFWWAAALVLVAGARGLANRRVLPLLVVLASCWGGYLCALAVTEWDPKLQLTLTFDRFLIQTSVPLLLLLALALENLVANRSPETPRRLLS